MVNCTIQRYFRSPHGRVLRFERLSPFAGIPPVGSRLDIPNDSLTVTDVCFVENGGVILGVEEDTFGDGDADDLISDMAIGGWMLASDHTPKSR